MVSSAPQLSAPKAKPKKVNIPEPNTPIGPRGRKRGHPPEGTKSGLLWTWVGNEGTKSVAITKPLRAGSFQLIRMSELV